MSLKLDVTLANGEQHEATILNPDRVRWDMAATRNGWPTFEKAPFLGMTYLAWASLKRENKYAGTWDEFKETDCLEVESRDEELEDDATGK